MRKRQHNGIVQSDRILATHQKFICITKQSIKIEATKQCRISDDVVVEYNTSTAIENAVHRSPLRGSCPLRRWPNPSGQAYDLANVFRAPHWRTNLARHEVFE